MALNRSPQGHEDNSKKVVGDNRQPVDQDPDTNKISTTKVKRGEGNIPISGHDLVDDGDFVIPDDVSGLDQAPFIGGGTQTILGVESNQGNQFSVKFEYGELDSDGNFTSRFTYDKNDDSTLDSDSSYIILVNTVLDHVKITLSDTSGAANNDIQGGFNAH